MAQRRLKPKSGKPALELVSVLRALADPVRLDIVRQLNDEGEKACGLFGLAMPKSSLSHHFRVLRQSGIIASESRGAFIMNRLEREALDAQFPGLLASVLAGSEQEPQTRNDFK